MKRQLIPLTFILLLLPSYVLAGSGISVWDKLGAGTLADADMIPITDVSDTTQSAEGSSKTMTAAQMATYVGTKITDATITTTDVTTNDASTSKHGWFPKLTAPSSGYLNIYGLANGETAATAKGLFDATSPSTQAFGDSAATGSAMSAARRDHKHAMPASEVSDTAFDATSWDNVTTIAPSKNAVRDKFESIIGTGTDGTYGISLMNNSATFAPVATYDAGFAVIGNQPYAYISSANARLQLRDTDLDSWAAIPPATGSIATTGNINGYLPPITITTAEGVHDGSNDVATLTDSGESFPTSAYVGMTLYNVTDGSSCVVTANNGTTMTCPLAGGTGNDWDTNDVWAVAPGPRQSGSMLYTSVATTILHPATAGYIACYRSTAAQVLKVDPQSSSMVIYLDETDIGAGDEVDSPGAAGNYICLHNQSTTAARQWGKSGTWIDGGSS